MDDRVKYRLDDAAARNKEFPTFEVPSAAEIGKVRPGDEAKLVFLYPSKRPDGCTAERMWVRITRLPLEGDPTYRGILQNQPLLPSLAGARRGDTITFEARHVASLGVDTP